MYISNGNQILFVFLNFAVSKIIQSVKYLRIEVLENFDYELEKNYLQIINTVLQRCNHGKLIAEVRFQNI